MNFVKEAILSEIEKGVKSLNRIKRMGKKSMPKKQDIDRSLYGVIQRTKNKLTKEDSKEYFGIDIDDLEKFAESEGAHFHVPAKHHDKVMGAMSRIGSKFSHTSHTKITDSSGSHSATRLHFPNNSAAIGAARHIKQNVSGMSNTPIKIKGAGIATHRVTKPLKEASMKKGAENAGSFRLGGRTYSNTGESIDETEEPQQTLTGRIGFKKQIKNLFTDTIRKALEGKSLKKAVSESGHTLAVHSPDKAAITRVMGRVQKQTGMPGAEHHKVTEVSAPTSGSQGKYHIHFSHPTDSSKHREMVHEELQSKKFTSTRLRQGASDKPATPSEYKLPDLPKGTLKSMEKGTMKDRATRSGEGVSKKPGGGFPSYQSSPHFKQIKRMNPKLAAKLETPKKAIKKAITMVVKSIILSKQYKVTTNPNVQKGSFSKDSIKEYFNKPAKDYTKKKAGKMSKSSMSDIKESVSKFRTHRNDSAHTPTTHTKIAETHTGNMEGAHKKIMASNGGDQKAIAQYMYHSHAALYHHQKAKGFSPSEKTKGKMDQLHSAAYGSGSLGKSLKSIIVDELGNSIKDAMEKAGRSAHRSLSHRHAKTSATVRSLHSKATHKGVSRALKVHRIPFFYNRKTGRYNFMSTSHRVRASNIVSSIYGGRR